MTEQKILSSYADECFRDVADTDYISARANYRLGLIDQFQWCASQAIEKYLKAILLYNQIPTKKIRHNLQAALNDIEKISSFSIDLNAEQKELILHLNKCASPNIRYRELVTYTLPNQLLLLDSTVWSIRRYCQYMPKEVTSFNKTFKYQEHILKKINNEYYKDQPHKFKIIGGFIEKILKKEKNNKLREALVWKNFKYGKIKKQTIKNFIDISAAYRPYKKRCCKQTEAILKKYI